MVVFLTRLRLLDSMENCGLWGTSLVSSGRPVGARFIERFIERNRATAKWRKTLRHEWIALAARRA
jgi:hypothetical protein